MEEYSRRSIIIVMKLILATNNKGKVKEFKEILTPLGFEVVSQSEAGIDIEVEETGTSFEENAVLKAKAVYEISKTYVIADDSGLEVDALNGNPGIYSARYEGLKTSHERNMRILEQLSGVDEERRTARFVCTICLIRDNGEIETVRGTCEGKIGYEENGKNGFGYDPIFVYKNRTLAQMSEDEKNNISHRGNAIKELLRII